MPECIVCDSSGATSRCSYCRGPVCADHHLPEQHDCPAPTPNPAQKSQTPSGEGIESPEPMDLEATRPASSSRGDRDTYGEHSRSLDVAPDGSISGEPTPEPDGDGRSIPLPDRYTAERWWMRLRDAARSLIRMAALTAVLIAAFNMLLAPFLDVTVFASYRTLLPVPVATDEAIIHLADVVLMAVGAAVAWFG